VLALAITVAMLVGAAVLVAFIGLGKLIEGTPSVEERLDALAPVRTGAELVGEHGQGQAEATGLGGIIQRLLSGRGASVAIAADLAQANLPFTAGEWVLVRIASVVAGFVLVLLVTQQLLFGVLGAAAGFVAPTAYLRRRQDKRLVAFQLQLPDVLTLLVGALRSGYGLTIAMDTVAKQMPAPTAEEFKRVVTEMGLGVPITQALANLVRRIRSEDLDLVVTAIGIQYEVGGNLAVILETITQTIRERVRLKEQMRVMTAQQRLQRIVLTLLPFALGVVIYVLNPEYMLYLFTPGPTLIIPVAALIMMGIGYVVMGRLANIEV